MHQNAYENHKIDKITSYFAKKCVQKKALDDGWPESKEEQVRKFQVRRRCTEDSKEKNVKDDEYERRADVRCVDVKRAKVRCVEVRRADVRCEDVRRAHVRCEDVRREAVRFCT